MAILKCKMCGGALEAAEGVSVCQCPYCGNSQTLPKGRDERIVELYRRANHLRCNDDYDKAAAIYEQILSEDNTDAEAYWSLVLCTYGVVYVESPTTHAHTPTLNRVQYTSIFDDSNYQSALRYADPMQQNVYRAQAAAINDIQKGILAVSQQESPYDVFICYKEKDADGNRTPDSVLGQELYYELTELGYKVFFARITLENKLGEAYEPYIFAALNSAKVMVVIGTKAEYVNATWVRNEWNRYLALIKGGQRKMLIPAYKEMDPGELPVEFSHLQAQNMEKLGFMQDLVRGIEKIVGRKEERSAESVAAVAAVAADPVVESLLKRVHIFLGNDMFAEAEEYCNKVLDIDPENGDAYVCQLLAVLRCHSVGELQQQAVPFDELPAYRHALRYADTVTVERLVAYNRVLKEQTGREEQARRQRMAEQQQRQLERQQLALQQEEEKGRIREANFKHLRLFRWLQLPVCLLLAAICTAITRESMGMYVVLIVMASFSQGLCAQSAYKWAADNRNRAENMRTMCWILTGITTGIMMIVGFATAVDAFVICGGTLFWAVALQFCKIYKEP